MALIESSLKLSYLFRFYIGFCLITNGFSNLALSQVVDKVRLTYAYPKIDGYSMVGDYGITGLDKDYHNDAWEVVQQGKYKMLISSRSQNALKKFEIHILDKNKKSLQVIRSGKGTDKDSKEGSYNVYDFVLINFT